MLTLRMSERLLPQLIRAEQISTGTWACFQGLHSLWELGRQVL